MTARIINPAYHIVCHGRMNVDPVPGRPDLVWTGYWPMSDETCDRLAMATGYFYWHEAINQPSYGGGRVLRAVSTIWEGKRLKRLLIQPSDAAAGIPWEGQTKGLGRGGLVDSAYNLGPHQPISRAITLARTEGGNELVFHPGRRLGE